MTDLDPKIRTAFESVRLDPSTREALLAQAEPKASGWGAWGVALAIAATLLLVAAPLTVSMDTVRAAFGLASTEVKPTVLSFDLQDLDGFLQAGDRAEVYAFADRDSGLITIGEVTIRDRQGSKVWIACTEEQVKPILGHQHLLRFAIVDGEKRRVGVLPDPIGTPDLGRAIVTGVSAITETRDNATVTLSEHAEVMGESAGIVEVRVPAAEVVSLLLAGKQGTLNLTSAFYGGLRDVVLPVPPRDLFGTPGATANVVFVGQKRTQSFGPSSLVAADGTATVRVTPSEAEQMVQALQRGQTPRLAIPYEGTNEVAVAVRASVDHLGPVQALFGDTPFGTVEAVLVSEDGAILRVPADKALALLMADEHKTLRFTPR